MNMNAAADDKHPVVVMETSKGSITIELDRAKAPVTVDNFLKYVDDGFYDGLVFHRVIPGFMIQGGGMDQDIREKKKGARDAIKNESDNGLSNARGTIAMARLPQPDTATSQFFINLEDNSGNLDPRRGATGYAVFGKVTEGMDVVDAIAKVKTRTVGQHENVPAEAVVIKSIKRKDKISDLNHAQGEILHGPVSRRVPGRDRACRLRARTRLGRHGGCGPYPRIGRADYRERAQARFPEALGEVSRFRGPRHGRRDRGQADPHKFTCRRLRESNSRAAVPIRGQVLGAGRSLTGPISIWRSSSSRMRASSIRRPAVKRLSRLPEIKESILTYGYPEGGSSMAITRGIVSRIEFKTIDYQTLGLRVQIDAAINPGNSGGPAVIDNRLVGIVFSAHARRRQYRLRDPNRGDRALPRRYRRWKI